MILLEKMHAVCFVLSVYCGLVQCQYQYPWLNNRQPNWGTNNNPAQANQQQYGNRQYPWTNTYGSGQAISGSSVNNQADPPRRNENPKPDSSVPNNPNYKWPNRPVQGGARGFNPNYQASASNQNSRFFSSGVPSEFFGNKVPAPNSEPAGDEQDCGPDTYKKFVFSCLQNNASSLLEADMSFPTKVEEVKKSCSLWSTFFICIRQKIQRCQNRKQFTEGLKDPISSLQKICTDENYQQQYLRQADCMRSVVQTYCPTSYNNLIARVKSEDTAIVNYCCDGLVLKQCAMAPLKEQCSSLAEEILVSTLHFLSKCGQLRPEVPCPRVNLPSNGLPSNRVSSNGVSSNGLPDPRNLHSQDLRRENGNNDIGKNINAGIRDNRIGNGRLVDQETTRATWKIPTTTPYWPVNIQPAEQKDPKSSTSLTTASLLLTWTTTILCTWIVFS